MNRWVTTLFVLEIVVGSTAHATGVNLYWGGCTGEGGTVLEEFACDSNTGDHTLYASFVPGEDLPNLVGLEAVVDLCSMANPFPDWWQFASGGCRASSLAPSADFTTDPASACMDPWGGSATTALSYYSDPAPWNRARITLVVVRSESTSVAAGTEYYGFKLRMSNSKTVGDGACGGCATPICIVLNQVNLVTADEQLHALNTPQMSYSIQW